MTRLFFAAFILCSSFCVLPGCGGGDSGGGVKMETVPPMTAEEKQQMDNYELEQQKSAEAYR